MYHAGYTGTSIFRLHDDSLTVIYFSNLSDELTDYDPDVIASKIASYYVTNSSFYLMQSRKDPDTQQTNYLQNVIGNLTKENVDSTAFTSAYFALLKHTLRTLEQRTQQLGEFKSLEYLDSDAGMNGERHFFLKQPLAKRQDITL